MLSLANYYLRKGISSLAFCSISFFIAAQCPTPDILPTVQCDSAPLLCLRGYCATTLNQPFVCCMNFCGMNTIINNPQYFRFIATAESIAIDIHVNTCSSGQGLQSAIVTSCDWAPCSGGNVPCTDILACDPGTSPGNVMHLIAFGLTIGQSYWLLIDGSNGSTCQYTIENISGVYTPALEGELDTMQTFVTPNAVCKGQENFQVVTGPAINGATGYLWNLEWSQQTIITTQPVLQSSITPEAPAGIWNICVRAFTGCDTTDPACTQLIVLDTETGASICCDQALCEGCTSILINLTGMPPWTIVISDGSVLDTISGITSSPFEYPVCLPPDSFSVQYTLIEVNTEGEFCKGKIIGDPEVSIELIANPFVFFVSDSIVCTSYSIAGYEWTACDSTTVLATTQCFRAPESGCYCLKLFSSDSCFTITCNDYVLGTKSPEKEKEVLMYPNPTHDELHIILAYDFFLPVHWALINPLGTKFMSGQFEQINSTINVEDISPGIYFLLLRGKRENGRMFKIIVD